jgi:hypothetical protein
MRPSLLPKLHLSRIFNEEKINHKFLMLKQTFHDNQLATKLKSQLSQVKKQHSKIKILILHIGVTLS